MSIKIIIAGSRTFKLYSILKNKMDFLLKDTKDKDITIISGEADGADKLGEKYAEENNYNLLRFPALWDKEGKSAGYKRNVRMAQEGTHCVVFIDKNSKGSQHMINIAKEYKLKLKVIDVSKYVEFSDNLIQILKENNISIKEAQEILEREMLKK